MTSQLIELSTRFPAHVQDLRDFLLKGKLPVPSPEAIPQLAERLEADARFRADVGSLLRATLYRERERVGHEELLGILVAAAAGTKDDLTSDDQRAAIAEMLRFVMQSRRATFRLDDEESHSAETEVRRPVAVAAVAAKPEALAAKPEALAPEPLLAARVYSRLDEAAKPVEREVSEAEHATAVTAGRGEEPGDLVLPPLRTSELFAAHAEREPAWWRAHPAWIAGVVCMLLGVGVGMVMHRVVSAAEMHAAVRAASSSSKTNTPGSVVANGTAAGVAAKPSPALSGSGIANSQPAVTTRDGITEGPVGTVMTGTAAGGEHSAAPSVTPLEGRAAPPRVAPTVTAGKSAVPVTVVEQVVTASPSLSDDGQPTGATQLTSATRTVVRPGAAGMTAANVIFSPAPEYPPAAAAARVHGQVTVHAVVDPDGNVIYARAVSGPAALRDAAEQAVQKWRYSPLLDNGKPIAVTTVAILDFKVAK